MSIGLQMANCLLEVSDYASRGQRRNAVSVFNTVVDEELT